MTRPFLSLDRRYQVPPEKVYRAWTTPEAIRMWWGPNTPGNKVSVADLDVRVGGRFRIVFGGQEGGENEVTGVYREVIPNEKLVFTWTWPRSTPERESLVTLRFLRDGGGTRLDFLHEQFVDEAVRDNHVRGWSHSLEKLEAFLKRSA